MSAHRSTYHFQSFDNREEAELLRLREQALMGWNNQFRTMVGLGLQDGMKVLEVGSGPGFITEKLLEDLPGSEITALDIDEVLLNGARQRLSHIPASRLQWVQASVYETGLPEGQYDIVIARLLFLHLHQPLEAAAELKRVLKPGGKLLIVDIDDGIFGAVHPEIDLLHSLLSKLTKRQAASGGNRHIGRGLPRLLTQAGFADVDMDACVQHSDLHGIEGFKRQFDIERFTSPLKAGLITESEYEQLSRSYAQFVQSPDAYAMMIYLLASGTKPE
ncbi:class I SAM-dependent methyltransferase [Paenibacillus kobensis]|uniref:class I SAM-dependent methyltransferase n=1 Tax=Paenibacillus kobensis TaxID=59841 RepID=UPI000FDA45DD|nr:methyltransferase domain-containing protein [Paenibacillus kobensis]